MDIWLGMSERGTWWFGSACVTVNDGAGDAEGDEAGEGVCDEPPYIGWGGSR